MELDPRRHLETLDLQLPLDHRHLLEYPLAVIDARHIEVQVVGDAAGNVVHLWERECTIQRRSQKIVELAPSPHLAEPMRRQIVDSAVTMATAVTSEPVPAVVGTWISGRRGPLARLMP